MRVFLSHSSSDKRVVRHINSDLKSHGFATWLDEEQIPFGGSIVDGIEKGLKSSDVLLIFISSSSTVSKWAKGEWHTKFFHQINEGRISVIPIKLDECEMPVFLTDRRYADFSNKSDYDRNFSLLLRDLQIMRAEIAGELTIKGASAQNGVFEHTLDILEELEDEHVSLPVHRRLSIIDTLKKIQRSGKRVRLKTFRYSVRIRSVYDHMLSVAHVADCLLPHIEHGIPAADMNALAMCIAYHELNEIVLGDIPTYTSLSAAKRRDARIYAEERLRSVPSAEREEIANRLVWLFLSEKHRQSLDIVSAILKNPKDPVYIMFKALDKMDPIIATWRYLHEYRGKIGRTPKEFNKRMKDFFENPDPKAFMRSNKIDVRMMDMLIKLQDRGKAWDYYESPTRILGEENLFQLPADVVRNAIEGVRLITEGDETADGR